MGLQLPVTLLYDCQSVSEMAEFIDARLTNGDTAAEAGQGAAPGNWQQRSSAITVQEPDRPSKLLKTLRRAVATPRSPAQSCHDCCSVRRRAVKHMAEHM